MNTHLGQACSDTRGHRRIAQSYIYAVDRLCLQTLTQSGSSQYTDTPPRASGQIRVLLIVGTPAICFTVIRRSTNCATSSTDIYIYIGSLSLYIYTCGNNSLSVKLGRVDRHNSCGCTCVCALGEKNLKVPAKPSGDLTAKVIIA